MVVFRITRPNHNRINVWSEVQRLLDQLHKENEDSIGHIKVLEAREPWSTDMESPVVDLVRNSYETLNIPMGRLWLQERFFLVALMMQIFLLQRIH